MLTSPGLGTPLVSCRKGSSVTNVESLNQWPNRLQAVVQGICLTYQLLVSSLVLGSAWWSLPTRKEEVRARLGLTNQDGEGTAMERGMRDAYACAQRMGTQLHKETLHPSQGAIRGHRLAGRLRAKGPLPTGCSQRTQLSPMEPRAWFLSWHTPSPGTCKACFHPSLPPEYHSNPCSLP